MASFQSVKEARNLLFDEDDYVCNIHDLDHGPMALSTIEKFDKREEGALQVADALPDSLPILSLATPDEAINLRDLHNDRPLVITFGSFSWRPWRAKASVVQKIAEDYHGKVDVVAIYISEAHSTDEWSLYSDVTWKQPQTIEERIGLATKHAGRLHGDEIQLYVDTMANTVESSFAAWPERLYIIDSAGKIGYKGLNGPDGYLPEEVRSWLEANVAV